MLARFALALLLAAVPAAGASGQSRELSDSYQEGAALYRAGKPQDAIPYLERALTLSEAEFGPDSSRTAFILNNLGVLYRSVGRHADAVPVLERALENLERSLGPGHDVVAQTVNELSIVHVARGDYTAAAPLLARYLAYLEGQASGEDSRLATAAYNLAYAQERRGDIAAARPLYERAHAIWLHTSGAEHADTRAAAARLAALDGRQPGASTLPVPSPPVDASTAVPVPAPAVAAPPTDRGAPHTAVPVPTSDVPRGWAVQLAAMATRAAAERERVRLADRYPEVLRASSFFVEEADLPKGRFFRLRVGPFTNAAEAQALCRSLRGSGQDCLVAAY